MLGISIAAVILVALGALVLWWASACRRGKFGRQWVLGYRTPLTLRNQDAWVAAHRAAAPLMFIAGGGAIMLAIVGFILFVSGVVSAPLFFAIAVGWLLLWLILGFIPALSAAHSAARSGRATRD